MIVDLILERREGEPYDAEDFYDYVIEAETLFDLPRDISRAMDSGDDEAVKAALCEYLRANGYNEKLCEYVRGQKWL